MLFLVDAPLGVSPPPVFVLDVVVRGKLRLGTISSFSYQYLDGIPRR